MLSIKLVRGHNDLTTGCYIGLDRTEWPAGLPLVSSLSNNAYNQPLPRVTVPVFKHRSDHKLLHH